MSTMRCLQRVRSSPVWLASCLLLLTGLSARAEPLDKYTGYTRPGTPDLAPGKRAALPVGEKKQQDGVGITVYFKVFDTAEGVAGDAYGTGYKNFDMAFVPGKDSKGQDQSPKLDSGARYLYTYQVVNDSGYDSMIKDVSIAIVVSRKDITSWGHFAVRKENEPRRGLSFNYEDRTGDKKLLRPVSQEFPGVSNKRYTDGAPAYPPPNDATYGLTTILLDNIRGADAESLDVGREPDTVLLVHDAKFTPSKFKRPGQSAIAPPLLVPLRDAVAPGNFFMVNPMEFSVIDQEQEARRSHLAVRAYFTDNPLKPGQRSTIFGFTSDLPPIYDFVRFEGVPTVPLVGGEEEEQFVSVRLGAGEASDPGEAGFVFQAGAAPTAAEGTVPTPAPRPAAAAAPAAPFAGLAGVPPLGGPGGFGGAPAGGLAGGFAPPGTFAGTGGGSGGGNGGGNGTGTPLQTQAQTPTQAQGQQQQQPININIPPTPPPPTPPPPPSPVTVSQFQSFFAPVTANQVNQQSQAQAQLQAQAQAQQQQQKQKQKQKQSTSPPTPTPPVVPEPAALFTALLGLPAFYLLNRRLRGRRAATA